MLSSYKEPLFRGLSAISLHCMVIRAIYKLNKLIPRGYWCLRKHGKPTATLLCTFEAAEALKINKGL